MRTPPPITIIKLKFQKFESRNSVLDKTVVGRQHITSHRPSPWQRASIKNKERRAGVLIRTVDKDIERNREGYLSGGGDIHGRELRAAASARRRSGTIPATAARVHVSFHHLWLFRDMVPHPLSILSECGTHYSTASATRAR